MSEIRYVPVVSSTDNWLTVTPEKGKNISLPYGLKVLFLGRRDNRDHFEILEGVNKGVKASVTQKAQNASYLVTGLRHLPGGDVHFDSKSQRLTFGGRGPINAFSGHGVGIENGVRKRFTVIPPGLYDLAIPAYPSAQTRVQYDTWTRYHQSWFRIGISTSGSRFLHAGEISDGCVTVRQFLYDGRPGSSVPDGFTDLPGIAGTSNQGLIGLPLPPGPVPSHSYDDLYRYLILRRMNDQAVGRLIVTDNGGL